MSNTNDNFFNKLKNWFLSIFKKDKVKLLNEPVEKIAPENAKKNVYDKEEMLEIYRKVRNGELQISDLDRDELIVFISLCKTEKDLYNKKTEVLQREADYLDSRIEYYNTNLKKAGVNI